MTRRTFRLPPQPLLEANGAKWEWLYKHLATQTYVYTWGSNGSGNLGLEGRGGQAPNPRGPFRSTGLPTEIDLSHSESIGVISDAQCGGWSTALMNARGQIFVAGVLNGQSGDVPIVSFTPVPVHVSSSPTSTIVDSYHPSTAIEQFSLGRASMLGLSDSGIVWQWHSFYTSPVAMDITDVVIDFEDSFGRRNHQVTKVVAGWTHNTAYIESIGLLRYWDAQKGLRPRQDLNKLVVPPPAGDTSDLHDFPKLQTYIVLEAHIVFLTVNNELYAWPLSAKIPTPVELTSFYAPTHGEKIRDLQGTFQNFGVITEGGIVLLGSSDLLHQYCHLSTHGAIPSDLPQPIIRPALQRSNGKLGSPIKDCVLHLLLHFLRLDGTPAKILTVKRQVAYGRKNL